MKAIHKERLETDLEQYCYQIGVLPDEVPSLYFSKKEFYAFLGARRDRRLRRKGYLGRCFWSSRVLFVDGHTQRTYRQLHHTMVHELVHYRFPWIGHGKKFELMIRQIIRGQRFDTRHIHFFEGYHKSFRQEISGDAILYPAVQ